MWLAECDVVGDSQLQRLDDGSHVWEIDRLLAMFVDKIFARKFLQGSHFGKHFSDNLQIDF